MGLGFNSLSGSTAELVKCQMELEQHSISKNNSSDSLAKPAVRAGRGGVRAGSQ